MKKLTIGLFGYGCVGSGLYQVLERSSIDAQIKKICIKDADKSRNLERSRFTTDKFELLNDPEINVIVELIDDPDAAFEIVCEAMKRGKSAVSANKKMIAENMEHLLAIQKKYKTSFLYEGACCASIPIIRNLEEYYDNDLLTSIKGIVNGSTNFILTELMKGNGGYAGSLQKAQKMGFAESDPTLDVEGYDAKYKLGILVFHAFGLKTRPVEIFNYGITRLNEFDVEFARKHGYTIKLLARAEKNNGHLKAYCLPAFVSKDTIIAATDNEYNALILETSFAEQQVLYGKGAGDTPTGSAVLSDVAALSHDYRYEFKKYTNSNGGLQLNADFLINAYIRYDENTDFDRSVFHQIKEEFRSETHHYLIGEISLRTLSDSGMARKQNVSIISFDS